jgi:hypothetical protein
MALFFSTYDYDINKGTFYIDETKNQSVLYRWRNLKPAKNILQQDYYSCHNLIPTYDILKSFGSCYTTDEFNQSLIAYAHAIQWDYKFDLQSIRSKRPHHLIKIPKHLLVNSRINKQKGYLLLPDVIIAEPQAQAETYLPPRYMKNLPLRLLQDLSEEGFCEIFIYKRDNALAKKMLADNNITPQEIYNEEKEDLSHLLLYNWFESIYKKVFDYGVMPVVEDPVEDFSYVDILHHLNTWQKKKQRAGYYFETAVG